MSLNSSTISTSGEFEVLWKNFAKNFTSKTTTTAETAAAAAAAAAAANRPTLFFKSIYAEINVNLWGILQSKEENLVTLMAKRKKMW